MALHTLSAFVIFKTVRSPLPAWSVPCQVPAMSCARKGAPSRIAKAMTHSISFFIDGLLKGSLIQALGCCRNGRHILCSSPLFGCQVVFYIGKTISLHRGG